MPLNPYRRRLLRNSLALPLLAVGIPGLIQQALASGTHPVAPGLHRAQGQVWINGKPAREGMLIHPGDRITTGPDSQAIYVVGSNAYLQHAQSEVDISAGAVLGEQVASGLRMLRGKLLSVFGKGPQRLETGTATIGIRGTGCYIEAEVERMYICLCYGEAEYVPRIAPERSRILTTTHHEEPVWISATDRNRPITPAPFINHNDGELILLENLVGRWPPFYGKEGLIYY